MNIKEELLLRAKASAFDTVTRLFARLIDAQEVFSPGVEVFMNDMETVYEDLHLLEHAAERLIP